MSFLTSRYTILGLLTVINLLNYLDRYILAALLPAIQPDLRLDDAQLGYLGSAFILMYFLASPVFGWLGDCFSRTYIISFGVFFWSLATAMSGAAKSFVGLLFARFGVGVGEAAYGTVTPAIISDLFKKEDRTMAFSWFFMAIPVGSALGYLLGGALIEFVSWRVAFFIVGVPGLLLALLLLFLRDPKRGQCDEDYNTDKKYQHKEALRHLLESKNYIFTVLGYTAYTFALGGLAHWMPSYVFREFNLPLSKANLIVGAVTVIGGFAGTFFGGWWGAKWQKRSADGLLKMSAVSLLLATPVFFVVLNASNLYIFIISMFIIEFLLFLSTSPINAEIVNTVNPIYRATANATCIFTIHIFGDAISPTLIGLVSSAYNLNYALYICPIAILLGGIFWALKCVVYFSAVEIDERQIVPSKFQSHRGLHISGKQENSLAAFEASLAAGFEMIELDVRLAKDGVPVVFHDKDLIRLKGKNNKIAETNSRSLAEIGNVPTLEQALLAFTGKVNIELKGDEIFNRKYVRAICETIKKVGAENRVMFSSFNPFLLRECAKQAPRILRALATSKVKEPGNNFLLRHQLLAFLARPHLLHLDQHMITAKYAKQLNNRRVPFAVWTVNDSQKYDHFFKLGAVSIITDNQL